MHALTAKPLGFPGAIAHGMWTKARCLAALEGRLPDAFAVEVRFRKPIRLPGKVEFLSDAGERGDPLRRARRKAAHAPPRRHRRAGRDEDIQPQREQREELKVNGNGKGSTGVAERSMGIGLRALNWLAGSDLLDRIGVRKQVERALFQGTKNGFRSATAAGRTFKAAQKLTGPARQATGKPRALFDISPDDEQEMFQEAVRDFAAAKVRPAAQEADAERATPAELLAQVNELGVNMLGVPEELGGVMHEQAATTSVLVGEALAHGDMGIAYAALAPGAVATAIGHWGTAEQQATYLPAFIGEDVPAAALALLEPRPLFDPLKLETTARRDGDGLGPRRRQVARRPRRRVRAVRRRGRGRGPRPGAVRDRVRRQGPLGRRTSRRWACGPPPPAACCSRTFACRRGPARRGRAATPTSSACSARGSPGARSPSAPRRRCSTT